MLNQYTSSLPGFIESEVNKQLTRITENGVIGRIWDKDRGVWSGDDENNWLGWLDIVTRELSGTAKYGEFADDIGQAGFEKVVLLGMGGSSLCPEVLAETFNKHHFHILDSTVPAQITTLEKKLDLSKTLFIVASKSGSTLEPNTFLQYFFQKVSEKVGQENTGRHFVAITDPGSKLQAVAERDGFRAIFYGDPAIGGRFSALSVFGMVPAAAMGINPADFLSRTNQMVNSCKSPYADKNPGAFLGAVIAVCQAEGRDKLTIFTSPEIYDVGAWLEQLIAESTGKQGVSIIPVDREEIQTPDAYGDDRVFVYLRLAGSDSAELDSNVDEIAANGQPVVTITLNQTMNLGQEFFRWEFATAVAGSLMEINPFNQPDVESAKTEAKKITSAYEETGALPPEKPFYEEDGTRLFTDQTNLSDLDIKIDGARSLANYITAHLARISEGDYFALLAYVEMNEKNEALLQKIRHSVLENLGVATCLGFGPRFLHSTGQGYKGGANNGVFLQITSDDLQDFAVPKQKFTFGVVKTAQARGDFQVLLDRKRRALRIHLGEDVETGLEHLSSLFLQDAHD